MMKRVMASAVVCCALAVPPAGAVQWRHAKLPRDHQLMRMDTAARAAATYAAVPDARGVRVHRCRRFPGQVWCDTTWTEDITIDGAVEPAHADFTIQVRRQHGRLYCAIFTWARCYP